jgi:hypothetical protein
MRGDADPLREEWRQTKAWLCPKGNKPLDGTSIPSWQGNQYLHLSMTMYGEEPRKDKEPQKEFQHKKVHTHSNPVKSIGNIINAGSSQIQSMRKRQIPQEENGEKWTHKNNKSKMGISIENRAQPGTTRGYREVGPD